MGAAQRARRGRGQSRAAGGGKKEKVRGWGVWGRLPVCVAARPLPLAAFATLPLLLLGGGFA